ncbi:MAG TPA: SUMF1/EgtB/PvdO family nonheme iron enzyme [Steroidobacteraceae bacterium]|nr:SUMF1/EgtB/PvdO family nonheme iron enzyme [Steroidobacteraceae bacterium]
MNEPQTPGSELIGDRTGFIVLAIAAVFIATWLYMQSRPATPSPTVPALQGATDLMRFREDAWYLPSDELLGFVEISAGTFAMGSNPAIDAQAFENERWSPSQFQGTVALPTFYIGRYEVTVAQYRAFVVAAHYKADAQALNAPGSQPVTHVSWTDALAFARWLTATLKESEQAPAPLKELLNEGWQFSLPTEAQWEKAARGIDGRIFPWGNSPSKEHANFGNSAVTAVGHFSCADCAHGLADMSGNLWELTRSPYQPYPYDESDDANDLRSDALWVMRGGSFGDAVNLVRTATRGGVDPGARRPFVGFRIVLTQM